MFGCFLVNDDLFSRCAARSKIPYRSGLCAFISDASAQRTDQTLSSRSTSYYAVEHWQFDFETLSDLLEKRREFTKKNCS